MTTESLRAFAARKGNAVSYWHKQKELGRLVMTVVDGKNMVDVEASEALIAGTEEPAKSYMKAVNVRQRAEHRGTTAQPREEPHRVSDSKSATYMQAKTAREVYEAKTAQFEYEEMTGKYLKKDEVHSTAFEIARALRDSLMNCARRIAADVAGLSSADECETVIEREHRALLENMTHSLVNKLGAPQ